MVKGVKSLGKGEGILLIVYEEEFHVGSEKPEAMGYSRTHWAKEACRQLLISPLQDRVDHLRRSLRFLVIPKKGYGRKNPHKGHGEMCLDSRGDYILRGRKVRGSHLSSEERDRDGLEGGRGSEKG